MTLERRLMAALVFTGACTDPNPVYVPDGGGSCSPGDRTCIRAQSGPLFPVVCTPLDGGSAAIFTSEPCPALAACQSGRCTAPAGAQGCMRQGDCQADQVCVPLDNGAALAEFCLPAPTTQGTTPPGGTCLADADCASLLCLQHTAGKFCLEACKDDMDCGIPYRCGSFRVTVTGIQAMIGSCTLPSSTAAPAALRDMIDNE